jgi:hypothetical protein
METCHRPAALPALDLPREFEELEGLLAADVNAIVTMLVDRARERFLLPRGQQRRLEHTLQQALIQAIEHSVAPLRAEYR